MWLFNFLIKEFDVKFAMSPMGEVGDRVCAMINQGIQRLLATIYKVLGLFADLMHIAFYIFAGVDMKAGEDALSGTFDIEVKSSGARENILDYFVFNESVSKAYWILAGIGLLLIVVFTIYKIVKQDYFDRAGPRSKGPIFRNVAISAISFLLVIPIFYVIIHVSSLLAVAVMDAMGMDASTFAGAQIFQLSWSDNGTAMRVVNNALSQKAYNIELNEGIVVPNVMVNPSESFKWMFMLQEDTMFVLNYPHYVKFSDGLSEALGEFDGGIVYKSINIGGATFYWYIYLVGVVIGIKTLYKLLLAMLQRIFKLVGLFVVAPSPISQYVLDDGQKFKSWLAQSIQEGLRLVVATMSFSIFLMVLSLVVDINFITPFKNAVDSATTAQDINVTTSLLSYNEEFANIPMLADSSTPENNLFYDLANAFMQIFVIIGAGGAVTDLDQVLTPLISGGKSSLDAGQTGSAANAGVQAVKGLAASAVASVTGGIASAPGAIKAAVDGRKEGKNRAEKELEETEKPKPENGPGGSGGSGGSGAPGGGAGGGSGGGNSGGDSSEDKEETATPDEQEHPTPTDEQGAGDGTGDSENSEEGAENVGDEDKETSTDEEGAGDGTGDSENSEEGAENVGGEDKETSDNGKKEDSKNKDDDKGKGGNSGGSGSSQTPKPSNEKVSDRVKHRVGNRGFGRVMKGIGRGFIGAGKVLKTTGKVLKTTGRVLGINGILKSTTKMLATAALGKDTVSAFADARKDAKAGAEKTKQDLFAAGQNGGYRAEKKKQAAAAKDIVDEKREAAKKAANDVTTAANNENTAAEELNNATDAAFEAQETAAERNDDVDKMKIGSSISRASASRDKAYEDKENAQREQQAIAQKVGVSDLGTLKQRLSESKADLKKLEEAEKQKPLSAREKGRKDGLESRCGELSSYVEKWEKNDQIIKDADKKIKTNSSKIGNRIDAQDNDKAIKATISGKDGALAKFGVTADMSHKEAKKKLQEAVKEGKSGAVDALANVDSVSERVYDNAKVKKAREANENVRVAKKNQSDAAEKHRNAAKATERAKQNLNDSMEEYGKSVSVMNNLDTQLEGSRFFNQRQKYTGETTKDGVMVKARTGVTDTHRMRKKSRKDQASLQEMRGIADSALSTNVSSVNTYADYNEWAKDRAKRNDQELANAGNQYMAQLSKNDTEINVSSNLGAYVTKNGEINQDAINRHLNAVNKPDKKGKPNEAHDYEHARIYGGLEDSMIEAQESMSKSLDTMVNNSSNSDEFRRILSNCKVASARDDVSGTYYDLDQLADECEHSQLSETDKKKVNKYITDTKLKFADVASDNKEERMTVGQFAARFEHDEKGIYHANAIGSNDANGKVLGQYSGENYSAGQSRQLQDAFNNSDYKDAVSKHASVKASLESGNVFMEANQSVQATETRKMEECTRKYGRVTKQVEHLDNVIASGGTNISPQATQIIAQTLGVKSKDINSSNAVEYATKARDIKHNEQVSLMKEGESHSKASDELRNELASMFGTITKSVDGKNAQQNNNTTNITNVNNNNINQQGQTPYWFDRNNNNSSDANGRDKEMSSMYDRMQLDGLKHMENMLERMRVEQKEMAHQVDEIKHDVDELNED